MKLQEAELQLGFADREESKNTQPAGRAVRDVAPVCAKAQGWDYLVLSGGPIGAAMCAGAHGPTAMASGRQRQDTPGALILPWAGQTIMLVYFKDRGER